MFSQFSSLNFTCALHLPMDRRDLEVFSPMKAWVMDVGVRGRGREGGDDFESTGT